MFRHHELLRNLRFHVTNPDFRATVPDFFYDDFLQLNGNSSKDALKVIEMLNSAPKQAQPDQLKTWKSIKRNQFELLFRHWPKDGRRFFSVETQYKEWQEGLTHYMGMCHVVTGKKHGIVR